MPPLRSICIVRLSAIGDVVLAQPLARTLRRAFPEARLTWVISPAAHRLLQGMAGVEFLVVDKPRGPLGWWRLGQQLRASSHDVLLAAQASLRANLLYPWFRAARKIGFDARRARDGHGLFVRQRIRPREEHLLEGFLGFAEALGVPRDQADVSWEITVPAGDAAAAAALLPSRPFVVIHPAASKPERTWFPEDYAAVARGCAERGLAVVLTGGGGEEETGLCTRVAGASGIRPINLAGRTNLKQLAFVLAQARAVVAPDTAAVHLANAQGTPVVGLYAVVSARLSGPYGAHQYTVDVHDEALRRIAGCDPGTASLHRRVHDREAMRLIRPEAVLAALERALAARR